MTTEQPSRSQRLLEIGRVGVRELIREPVRESVREALAEERELAEDRHPAEERKPTEKRVEPVGRPDDPEESGTGSRLPGPAVLLPALGLVAAGIVARRRRHRESADETDAVDEDDETTGTQASGRRSTTDPDPTTGGDSMGDGAHERDAGPDDPTDDGDLSMSADDGDLSTTE